MHTSSVAYDLGRGGDRYEADRESDTTFDRDASRRTNRNLLPPRPPAPINGLNPTAATFSPSRQPSTRPDRSATDQEHLNRSSIGYPFTDDNRSNYSTRSRQRFFTNEEDSAYYRRTSQHFVERDFPTTTESLTAENSVLSARKDKIEQLKRFDPVRTLQFSLKDKKVLTNASVSFVPWKDYMEKVFRSCYLECLVFMDPRWATGWERKDWEELDRNPNCIDVREFTYNTLAVMGSIPAPSSEDPFETLNGVFLGVMKAFPQLQTSLITIVDESLDKAALNHFKARTRSDIVTLRMMYFKGRLLFMDPLNDARMRALADFSQNTKYDTSMSPMEFLEKTIIKAETVDELFDSRQVTDGWLWAIVTGAITKATGDFYDSIVDTHRKDPGYLTQSRKTLTDVVTSMDNKYKEKKRSNSSMYGMFVTDGIDADIETLNYAGSSHRPKHDHHHQSKGKGGGKGHASTLPCFAFQRGKCAFGSKCKFSHNDDVIKNAPPPPSIENMAALVDSVVELNVACAAQRQNYKKQMKKMKKTLKHFKKKKPDYPEDQTYQKVTDTVNAAVAEDKTDPLISIAEVPSDGDTSTSMSSDTSE